MAMTVLSRGARTRRGGRRPGWVLLTVLLVLVMGASSALVFTNRVELLKLAVILALWAAIAGAFVSVLYRRQADADQSRVRDLKLVYDLQLDREISARREYELTVESQLRRELASELRAQAADDVAALRAELAALRTSLEILFDTDLEQRRALENQPGESDTAGAYGDWGRNGEGSPVDWVTSDRVTSVRQDHRQDSAARPDEASIIDVPEVGVPSASAGPSMRPRPAAPPPDPRLHYEAPPPSPEPRFEPRQPPSPPPPQPEPHFQPPRQDWRPTTAEGQWLPPGSPGSNWASGDAAAAPPAAPSGRRARHSTQEEFSAGPPRQAEPAGRYGESGRRARTRHAAEYPDFGVEGVPGGGRPGGPDISRPAPPPAAATPPPPPRLAPPPPPEPAPRHRGADPLADEEAPPSGGQSVADLLARLQVEPSGGGRRRRREG
jgi:hypothetical protein